MFGLLRAVICGTYLLWCGNACAAEALTTVYSFGIGPQQSATELAKRWTPILQYLSEKSGLVLQFRTAKDISTFQHQMRDGVFDFAYINPYHYLLFRKSAGYTAFAHEKDGKLIGVLPFREATPQTIVKAARAISERVRSRNIVGIAITLRGR